VPIQRGKSGPKGLLSILMSKRNEPNRLLPENLNDNKIINQLIDLHAATGPGRGAGHQRHQHAPQGARLRDRGRGLQHRPTGRRRVLLSKGYHSVTGSFWDRVSKVETRQDHGRTWHQVQMIDNLPAVHINEFIIDEQGFVGWIKGSATELLMLDLHQEPLLHQEAWGLKPRDIYRAWRCSPCSTRTSTWST
jgi:PhoH-like ATPase